MFPIFADLRQYRGKCCDYGKQQYKDKTYTRLPTTKWIYRNIRSISLVEFIAINRKKQENGKKLKLLSILIHLQYFRRPGTGLNQLQNLSAYPFGTRICKCSLLSDTATRTLYTCHRSRPAFLMPYRMFPGLSPLLPIRYGTEIRHKAYPKCM